MRSDHKNKDYDAYKNIMNELKPEETSLLPNRVIKLNQALQEEEVAFQDRINNIYAGIKAED